MLSRRLPALVAAAFALLLAPASLFADGMIIIPPRPVDPPNWRAIPLAVNYHKVEVKIDNQVAVTSVDQEFRNPNNMQLEGLYIFPLPAGASVSKFSMWIDGQETEAELLERDKAAQIYEGIVRQMKDPALLEYMGTRAFKLRIFPIPALGTKRVRLEYSEVIGNDNGLCTYRYPLNTEKFSSAPLDLVALRVQIASQLPLKNVFSPSHNVDVVKKGDKNAVVSFEQSKVLPDKDFILYYTLSEDDFGVNLLTWRKAGEDGYFMLLVAPKQEAKDADVIRKDVVFVIDTSGSMVENNKIDQAKKALRFCVQSLNAGDRFNVISFATEARRLKDGLVEWNDANKAAALEFIDGMKARGGTAIHEALQSALDLAPNDANRPFCVVFVTDGNPTIGESREDAILGGVGARKIPNLRLFTFGVGYDLNAKLLDKLADLNHGARDYATPEENIEVKVSNFYDKIAHPVLADVKLAFEGLEAYDRYPKEMPDLFRGSQLVVYGRYKGEGHKAIHVTGKVNGAERRITYEANFAATGDQHDALPRLWAVSKIGYLLDEIRLRGENPELKSEVVSLAKQFGILTPYTSYLVLEDVGRRQALPPGSPGAAAPAPADEALRRGFEGDSGLREEAEAARDAVGAAGERAGAGGVDASQTANEMKSGRVDAPSAGGGGFSGFKKRDKDAQAKGKQGAAQPDLVKLVAERTFYKNGEIWYDAGFKPGTETVKVKYLSDEYFKLLADAPGLAKFLALGTRVVVLWEGKPYEVTE
ncbi:MAG: VWA domain-containing protein [Planctomycetes bacterium]|nr:VWA domain-containing protein [Planctomycetota bacterium]